VRGSFPTPSPINNQRDVRRANVELFSKPRKTCSSCLIELSDFFHVHLTKFSATMRFLLSMKVFFHHVINVVLTRSEEEVSRINAPLIIAAVTNPNSIGDLSEIQSPRKSMRRPVFSRKKEFSVSVAPHACLPIPAFIGTQFINLLPKSFHKEIRKRDRRVSQ
jgi:hypothetical protein